jgi:hypothetical protein
MDSQPRPELSLARLVGRQERAPRDAVHSNCIYGRERPEQRFRKEKPMPSLISRVRLLAICMQICVLLPACLAVGSPSFARSNFDGDWSVFIQTRGGACPPSVRYPVAITNGIVSNAGDVPAAVQGRVGPSGAVRVTVQSGGSWASGSGRLGATSGSGIWRGQGTNGVCQGTWQAQRRSLGAEAMQGRAPIYNYAPGRPRQYYPSR